MSAPLAVGPVVVLHGGWLRLALDAMLIAARARRLNGLPVTDGYRQLAQALHSALSADGHTAVPSTPAVPASVAFTVTVEEAATTLRLSRRQTRRLAPRLGGRRIAGRWLLDELAIREHMEGRENG